MIKELILEREKVGTGEDARIVLFNDNVNSFDWVIKCLVEVLDHEPEQAAQCAQIAHYKGKYAVKSGSFEELRPRAEALGDRGLTVELQ